MKVAVIGANGFIGTRIVECFHLSGELEVAAVVRRPSSLALPARFDLDLRVADALDAGSLAKGLAGCDSVVHVALGDSAQIRRMPEVLCKAAEAAGIRRLVYMSSASVHGQNPPPGTNESSPIHMGHAIDYNNAKVAAERRFTNECRRRGLDGYSLRPSMVYGPRSQWLADVLTQLQSGRAWLLDDGRGICNGIYVDNLVAAIRSCLGARSGTGGAYLVGDAETVTWRQFYSALAVEMSLPPSAVTNVNRPADFPVTWAERAKRIAAHSAVQLALPWVPYTLKRGARKLIGALSVPPIADSWAIPRDPDPVITREMAELQSCSWKLPSNRARDTLGYVPTVPFVEAVRRSVAWWRFAKGQFRIAI